MSDIRIMIADDHPIFVDGIVSLIGGIDGFSVVSTAENGREALEKIPVARPDIILMDINMPEMDGVEAPAPSRRITRTSRSSCSPCTTRSG